MDVFTRGPAILSTSAQRCNVLAWKEVFLQHHRAKFGIPGLLATDLEHEKEVLCCKSSMRTVLYTFTTATMFNAAT